MTKTAEKQTIREVVEERMAEKSKGTLVRSNVAGELDRLSPVFDAGILFNGQVGQMTPEQRTAGFAMVKAIAEICSARQEQFRQGLFVACDSEGELQESGTRILEIEGSKVMKIKNTKKDHDRDKLKELLAANGIGVTDVIKVKTVTTTETYVDESVLDALVETGRLKRDELEALKPVNYSLRVSVSEEIEAFIDSALNKVAKLPPADERKDGKKKSKSKK